MSTIYKKQGRRYIPIGEYDDEAYFYPKGASLVICRPGSTLTRYDINPDHAALLAAAQDMRDGMEKAMRELNTMEPVGPLSPKQKRAWEAYIEIAGPTETIHLRGKSFHEIVDAGIKVLIDAASKAAHEGGKG